MSAPPSPPPNKPLSERVVEATVIGFAVWTLVCHLVVWQGGSFRELSVVVVVVLPLVALGWWSWRKSRSSRASSSRAEAGSQDLQNAATPSLSGNQLSFLTAALVTVIGVSLLDRTLITWGAISAVLVAFCLFEWRHQRRKGPAEFEAPRNSRATECALWAMGALAAMISLLFHRADKDDAAYINFAVGALDNPRLPLLEFDTLHGIEGLPIQLDIYRVHSLEILGAIVSALTGLPPIAVFHWIFAAAGAFLTPLAAAATLRMLQPRLWPLAVAFLLFIYVAVGEPHRWYSNFAMIRMWQGKSIFLCVLLPVLYAGAMRFARAPTLSRWGFLFMAQVAAIGLTSSALWIAPLAVGLTGVSVLLFEPARWRYLPMMAASSLYPLVIGSIFKASSAEELRLRRPAPTEGAPTMLTEAFDLVLGRGMLPAVSFFALLTAWTFCRPLAARRFCLVLVLLVWLILLNPFLAGWTSSHIIGPSFWRALWALPIPLLVACCLAGIPAMLRARRPGIVAAAALGIAFVFAIAVPEHAALSRDNRARFSFPPRYKVPYPYEWARSIHRATESGASIIAPDEIGLWLPTFRDHPFPLAVRHYLIPHRRTMPRVDYDDRHLATRFVSGESRGPLAYEAFVRSLRRYDVQTVCFRSENNEAAARAIRDLLPQRGFCRAQEGRRYELWVRQRSLPGLPGLSGPHDSSPDCSTTDLGGD